MKLADLKGKTAGVCVSGGLDSKTICCVLKDAGVIASNITPGIVARGVSDLWNYGESGGKLSSYFMQRATQL